MALSASIWDPASPNGPARDSAVRAQVGREHLAFLLPPQFVLATFSSIGGRMLEWTRDGALLAVGYSLPTTGDGGSPCQYISYLPACSDSLLNLAPDALKAAYNRARPGEEAHLWDVTATGRWQDPLPLEVISGITYAQPRKRDAGALRQLQAQVWQARPENLYPVFLHHPDFQGAWSLVARTRDQVVGFLLGFRHEGKSLVLPGGWPKPAATGGVFESQVLGIHPEYRRLNIAYQLKRIQAQELSCQNITHIQWTADPLQYRNTSLNCNRLGAVGTQLLPDYLPFRNELNRVPASRLRLIWPLAAAPVQRALSQGRASSALDLDTTTEYLQVHENLQRVRYHLDAPRLAIEIPKDWTHLQKADLPLAQAWREVTDQILTHYLGPELGQYVVTQTGRSGDCRYLIASQIGSAMLRSYGS